MAIHPTLFGHVELPDPAARRDGRLRAGEVGVRLVRPVDPFTDKRRREREGRS